MKSRVAQYGLRQCRCRRVLDDYRESDGCHQLMLLQKFLVRSYHLLHEFTQWRICNAIIASHDTHHGGFVDGDIEGEGDTPCMMRKGVGSQRNGHRNGDAAASISQCGRKVSQREREREKMGGSNVALLCTFTQP